MSMAVFLLGEAFFQFPFTNPIILLIVSVAVGFFMYLANIDQPGFKIGSRLAVGLYSFFVLSCVPQLIASATVSIDSAPYRLLSISCDIFPHEWQNCLAAARYERNVRETDNSISRLNRELERNPLNPFAMEEIAKSYFLINQRARFCFYQILSSNFTEDGGYKTRDCKEQYCLSSACHRILLDKYIGDPNFKNYIELNNFDDKFDIRLYP